MSNFVYIEEKYLLNPDHTLTRSKGRVIGSLVQPVVPYSYIKNKNFIYISFRSHKINMKIDNNKKIGMPKLLIKIKSKKQAT